MALTARALAASADLSVARGTPGVPLPSGGAVASWFKDCIIHDPPKGLIGDVASADVCFVCVPTPFGPNGFDDSYVWQAVSAIPGSKIVVNTQPPLHELWLAARAGGYHFRWVDGAWRDTRDGVEFFSRLSQEASAQAGRALDFSS